MVDYNKVKNYCLNCGKKIGNFSKKILVSKEKWLDDFHWCRYVCSEECEKELMKKANKIFEEGIKLEKEANKDYLCNSCSYKWTSRKSFGTPAICPKCLSQHIIKYSQTPAWEKEQREDKEGCIKNIIGGWDGGKGKLNI